MWIFYVKIKQKQKKKDKPTVSFSGLFSMQYEKAIVCVGGCACVKDSALDGSGVWAQNYVPIACVHSSFQLAEAQDFEISTSMSCIRQLNTVYVFVASM